MSANYEYMKSYKTKALEILAVLITSFLPIIGVEPVEDVKSLIPYTDYPVFNLLVWIFGRQIYGLCLSYLVYLALNPANTMVSFFRPSRIMNMILSWRIWIPVATLSYSMYLFHLPYLILFGYGTPYLNPFID